MIQQCICTSFLLELLSGTHNLASDTLKVALFTNSASLAKTTTVYSTTGEISATGYTAGGATLTKSLVATSDGGYEVVFSQVTWGSSNISAARGALIYNSSKSNKAIAVLNFGSDKASISSSFVLKFPATGSQYPVLKIK